MTPVIKFILWGALIMLIMNWLPYAFELPLSAETALQGMSNIQYWLRTTIPFVDTFVNYGLAVMVVELAYFTWKGVLFVRDTLA